MNCSLSPTFSAFPVASCAVVIRSPNLTALATETSPDALPTFYETLWGFLRATLTSLPATRHSPLRVSFLVHQGAPGPLAHAALYYGDDARRVLRTLDFAPGLPHLPVGWSGGRRSAATLSERGLAGTSEAARGCAYAYFGGWVAKPSKCNEIRKMQSAKIGCTGSIDSSRKIFPRNYDVS